MRNLLIALVLILWCLLGLWFWQLSKKCCSENAVQNIEASAAITKEDTRNHVVKKASKSGPLLFKWSDKTPIFGEGWHALQTSLKSKVSDTNHLVITGHYRKDEMNNTSFENLGLARADSVRQAMFADINPEHVKLASSIIGEEDMDKTDLFESATFTYARNTQNVKQIADRTLIYFPYNSTQRLKAADVDAYLVEVAQRVKASGERVFLSGHTDSYGGHEENLALGLLRANVIKDILIKKGISPSKIIVESKGETVPVASNETAAGRAQNRRTELQINK